MFKQARIKLTAWYLMIIMLISLSFSAVIYRVLTFEFERFERIQRIRIQRRYFLGEIIPPKTIPLPFDPDLINETKSRLVTVLFLINSGILFISGGVGYFLAGRTLRPIQEMVTEQNRFISDSSHELRTPLTALKTSLEVALRDKQLDLKNAKAIFSDSLSEVNRLQSLSDELLQLAQYHQPKDNLKFEKLSLKKVVEESIQKIQPLAREKNISFSKNIKEAQIRGIKYSLTDLFVIILDNSIKYSAANKQVTVDSAIKDGIAKVSIVDQGIGISPPDLPHIFDRFYRADSVRSRSDRGGYGLGLSIAKKIIEMHKGNIEIKSEKNRGTKVIVKLPLFRSFKAKKENDLSG